jgi:hypothetical protein
MTIKSKHFTIPAEELMAKYDQSDIANNLHLFKKFVDDESGKYCGRVTETYKDPLSRKKVLIRHFFQHDDGTTKMTVTYLRLEGIVYEAKRNS